MSFDGGKPSTVVTPNLQVPFDLQYKTKSGKLKLKKLIKL